MMRMEWKKLLTAQRAPGVAADEGRPARPFYDRNYERILFSASFRRLANKTQVHPLYQNDNLHHRLIHSVEVGSVAHTLGVEVGQKLAARGDLEPDQVARIAGISRAAALAHDIGNPPFGHSGEEAIGDWFKRKFKNVDGLWAELTPAQQAEFTAFEGNAQGFRILTRNEIYHPDLYENGEGMALAGSVLGAFTKYPVRAEVSQKAIENQGRENVYCGLKKYGLFESSWPYFEQIAQALGLIRQTGLAGVYYSRHPLVFLVEAADDICYNIMDLEDAVTSGDLPFARVEALLLQVTGAVNLPDALADYPSRRIAALRAHAITKAVAACVDAFLKHYDAIMTGRLSGDLIGHSIYSAAFAEMKKVSSKEVFTALRKTELEIYGRNLIHEILNQLADCLQALARCDYDRDRFNREEPYSARLLKVVKFDLLGICDAYSAVQAMTDFVSGMTDRYAVHFVKMTKGGL
ncbi:MAG TPA: dNTP triphosphohydrolase [Paenirhodobacter sp.]